MATPQINTLIIQGAHQLQRAVERLEYSYNTCKQIDFTATITNEKLEKLESFSARFARISDLFTQKILKSIGIYLREDLSTVIDRLNFAEKIGLIQSADDWKDIRAIRNQIVHDYIEEDLIIHHNEMFSYYSVIVDSVERAKSFIEKNIDES